MRLPVPLSLEPMEAEPVQELPSGSGWVFEPKYDGFRCLVFRDGEEVALQSRRQRPLARFFPEVAANIAALPVSRCVLDGELVIAGKEFDTLQLRLHPAASRIARLSREAPATFVAFDLLVDEAGCSLLEFPFSRRRAALVALFDKAGGHAGVVLSKETPVPGEARRWLDDVGRGLDGIVAKRLDLPYQPGRREMLKFKLWHSVDCVLGGVYCKPGTRTIEYLLCGLYDEAGRLNYVGRCTPGGSDTDASIDARIRPLIGGEGFTGEAPGGPSRWSRREREVTKLRPELVVEVSADHVTAGKFRHGSRFVRWRDDKDPRRCTMDQIQRTPSGHRHTGQI